MDKMLTQYLFFHRKSLPELTGRSKSSPSTAKCLREKEEAARLTQEAGQQPGKTALPDTTTLRAPVCHRRPACVWERDLEKGIGSEAGMFHSFWTIRPSHNQDMKEIQMQTHRPRDPATELPELSTCYRRNPLPQHLGPHFRTPSWPPLESELLPGAELLQSGQASLALRAPVAGTS